MADTAPVTQGTALSATQLNAAAKFAGSFAYSPAAGTVLAAGTHTLSVTFTPADTSLYTTATASTTLVVTVPRTTPTVSWATPAAITQGTALSATQLNATASVPGTFLYAPAAGTVLAAGTHTLGATFTPADTTRYTTATASTTLAVTAPPTAPTVSWRSPAAITQGTPLGATQLNATASVPGTFAYTPAAGIYLAAGTHMLRATFTPADTARYTSTTAMTALVVNPPPFQLTVLRPTGGTISAAGIPAAPGAPTARRACRWRSGSGSGDAGPRLHLHRVDGRLRGQRPELLAGPGRSSHLRRDVHGRKVAHSGRRRQRPWRPARRGYSPCRARATQFRARRLNARARVRTSAPIDLKNPCGAGSAAVPPAAGRRAFSGPDIAQAPSRSRPPMVLDNSR